MKPRRLTVVPGRYSICRFAPQSDSPAWIDRSAFHSETRTHQELSIVCTSDCVPNDVSGEKVTREEPWSLLEVAGPIDFGEIGIVASLSVAVAQAGVSIFVISTYNTDYILVKEPSLNDAVDALLRAGHIVERPTS